MNLEQMTNDLSATTARLAQYHTLIARWHAFIDADDPNCAERRALVGALKERLNRAQISVAAVQRRPVETGLFPPAPMTRLDMERMTMDLDRSAERLNTYFHRAGTWVRVVMPGAAVQELLDALLERTRLARMAVIAAREAARKVSPADYRVDEILF